MKTRQDNDLTDRTDAIYAENKTELLWSKGLDAVYDETKTGQQPERSYRCGLHRKQDWIVRSYWIGYDLWRKLDWTMTWPVVHVQPTPKVTLSYSDRWDQVQSVMKTR